MTATDPQTSTRVIVADALHKALVEAGVVRDGERIRRIVIDALADHAVVMHIERWGDDRLLKVLPTLEGVEVSAVDGRTST